LVRSVRGGKAGVFDGAGAGETILNAYDVRGRVGEIDGPGGFSIYKEGQMAVDAGYSEGGPLREVAAEAGEVGIPAGYCGAGGIEAEVADAGSRGEGDDEYVVLTLYQYLDVLAHAGALRRAGLQRGLEAEVGVIEVSQIFHIE